MEFLVPFLFPGLFFLYLQVIRHETIQDVQEVLPPEFHEACQPDAQVQPELGQPDARRDSPLGHGEAAASHDTKGGQGAPQRAYPAP